MEMIHYSKMAQDTFQVNQNKCMLHFLSLRMMGAVAWDATGILDRKEGLF